MLACSLSQMTYNFSNPQEGKHLKMSSKSASKKSSEEKQDAAAADPIGIEIRDHLRKFFIVEDASSTSFIVAQDKNPRFHLSMS